MMICVYMRVFVHAYMDAFLYICVYMRVCVCADAWGLIFVRRYSLPLSLSLSIYIYIYIHTYKCRNMSEHSVTF